MLPTIKETVRLLLLTPLTDSRHLIALMQIESTTTTIDLITTTTITTDLITLTIIGLAAVSLTLTSMRIPMAGPTLKEELAIGLLIEGRGRNWQIV